MISIHNQVICFIFIFLVLLLIYTIIVSGIQDGQKTRNHLLKLPSLLITYLKFVGIICNNNQIAAFIQRCIQGLASSMLSHCPNIAMLDQDQLVHALQQIGGLYKTLTEVFMKIINKVKRGRCSILWILSTKILALKEYINESFTVENNGYLPC